MAKDNFFDDVMTGRLGTQGAVHHKWLTGLGKQPPDPKQPPGRFDWSDAIGFVLVLAFLIWLGSPERERREARPPAPRAPGPAAEQTPIRQPGFEEPTPPAASAPPETDALLAPSGSPLVHPRDETVSGNEQPAPVAVFAKHKHRMRDCEGTLTFFPDAIQFESSEPKDSFKFSINDVALDNDRLKDPSGKAWHFVVAGRDMHQVFRQWKAGQLNSLE